MAVVLPSGKQQVFTATGAPGIGYRMYTYAAGTLVPQVTYQDPGGTIPHTNPIVFDSRGERAIYWDGAYDVILKDADDVLVWGPERLDSTVLGGGGGGGGGEPGEDGTSTGIAYLYQWSATQPANPTGTSNYTWSTAAHDTYTGFDGWYTTAPSNPGVPGILLWVASKPLSALAPVAVSLVTWTSGFTIAAWSQNGLTGSTGVPGIKTAQPEIYQWAATIPAGPTGTSTYTWETLTFTSVPAGWNAAPGASPSTGYTLWAAVVPISETVGQAQTVFNWTVASIMARGYSGLDGATGNFIAYVFKRAATIPATPSGDGVPSGWYDAPPVADGNPLFMSTAEQTSAGVTVGSWSTPVQLDGTGGTVGPDGASISVEYSIDGATLWHSTFTAGDIYMRQQVGTAGWSDAIRIVGETGAEGNFVDHIFKRAATIPATPTGDGLPTGWADSPPAADGNPLWMSVGTKTYADALVGAWGTPSAINGDTGATGATGDSITVEYSINGSTSWHSTFTTGDIYMRQRVGSGAWSAAIRIVGEVGATGAAGSTGTAGASYRLAYAKVTGSSLATTPSTLTTSGSSSFPATGTWGGGEVWGGTVPTFTAGESIFQTDGIYSPATGNTVWGIPYLSSLKVGSLSAISANLGTITSGNITLDSASSIKGGQTAYDTGNGFFLGYTSGTYKFSIGSGAASLKWDGSTLSFPAANITGQVTTPQITPNAVTVNVRPPQFDSGLVTLPSGASTYTASAQASSSYTNTSGVVVSHFDGTIVVKLAPASSVTDCQIVVQLNVNGVPYSTQYFTVAKYNTVLNDYFMTGFNMVSHNAAGLNLTHTYSFTVTVNSGSVNFGTGTVQILVNRLTLEMKV